MRDLNESIEDGFLLQENKILYEVKHILDVKYESVTPDGLVAVCDYINTKERQELLSLWRILKTYLMVV